MNILITGVCGFIGFSLAEELLKKNCKVIGIDNINNYFKVQQNALPNISKDMKIYMKKLKKACLCTVQKT